jgi:hypothetical protein
MASKPLLIAGTGWPALAKKLAVEQVLRIDAEGRVEVSAALYHRLEFVGDRPKTLEIIP